MKRIFDLVISSFGLLVLFPILLIVASAIKLDSMGPVFYRGERVGRNGKIFRIYKFRSMKIDADKIGGTSTSANDPRITRVGCFIRKFKIDELPQLINVLSGDMSIVGPRPQVEWAVSAYNDEERKVLELRPGITDWASIRFRNEGDIIEKSGIADYDKAYMKLIHPEKMRLQKKYLNERSIWVDIRIILLTITSIFNSRTIDFGFPDIPDNGPVDRGKAV